MVKLTLYQFEMCPYCAKVREALFELGLEYDKVDVAHDREDPQRLELHKKSGVWTVPVLQVDEKFIGESSEILMFLKTLKH